MNATFNIILHIRVIGLMIMDHLNNLKKIILLKLRHAVGHLLDIIRLLLAALSAISRLANLALLVTRKRASLAKDLLQSLGGVLEGDCLNVLVGGLEEVEIVNNSRLATLLGGVAVDRHLKLTPALILALEGGFVESYRNCEHD